MMMNVPGLRLLERGEKSIQYNKNSHNTRKFTIKVKYKTFYGLEKILENITFDHFRVDHTSKYII